MVSRDAKMLGVIELKDIVKGGIKERFAELRQMGIKTVMITGDNPLTAAAIAAEAGVDDFLAEATPEAKLSLIREYQKGGRLVAMTGDGTNDAPGTRSSRRGRRHELRHAGREGSGQHGRSRFESNEAHRDREHRQTVADDSRSVDDVQHCQRRSQVLRDPAGGICRDLSRIEGVGLDATVVAIAVPFCRR